MLMMGRETNGHLEAILALNTKTEPEVAQFTWQPLVPAITSNLRLFVTCLCCAKNHHGITALAMWLSIFRRGEAAECAKNRCKERDGAGKSRCRARLGRASCWFQAGLMQVVCPHGPDAADGVGSYQCGAWRGGVPWLSELVASFRNG